MPELIWDGKYHKDGRKTAPLRVALPFQTVETINESSQDRQQTFDLIGSARESQWRNRLVWGDKKYVLPAMLQELAGKVNLVYIDPPFGTGQDFSLPIHVGETEFLKVPSMIEVKAYRDTWGKGLDGYLQWFYETAIPLHELLAENGTLYVHCNQDMSPYVRLVLDDVFGVQNHLNDVVWHFENKPKFSFSKVFPRDWEIILVYAKSAGDHQFQHALVPVKAIQRQAVVGWDPVAKKRVAKRDDEGRIIYETRTEKLMGAVWILPIVHPVAHERLDYPTQKPETLLERIIRASSTEGDLILDCFVGSGTTAAVAEKLGRRWIAADLSRFAIHTTRKRLLSIEGVRPFIVQNLGKYERQVWQVAEFGEKAQARTEAYRRFILELYGASRVDGYLWLHGIKQGRMVHVGTVDAPVTAGDVKQVASEFRRAVGTGSNAPTTTTVDVLGWDFAFELNEVARQTASRAGIEMRFWRIPREVLDKRAVQQGDVRFYELAALAVEVSRKRRLVTLRLTDFVIPLDDVPQEIQRAISNWIQWIDYWAIDWDNKGDAFHNEWQNYRTPKEPQLQKSVTHEYAASGTYTAVVKVIDILGNDTTKTLRIEVA